jgi:phage-related baseplate assembly protein
MPDIIQEELDFIEVDAEVILGRMIENFEYYTNSVLNPADERRMFLHGLALVRADEQNYINETGKGNLIRFASDKALDAIGELFQSPRLEAEKATVTMQITFSESMGYDLTLSKGTRVTADGTHLFAIDEDVILEANSDTLVRTVTATATEAGAEYNDFAIGQINRIVDTNPYVFAVANIDTSKGGTDIEDDESYKERLRIAPFTFSVAGPAESYRAIALSVSNQIGDVYVYSPSAGVVEIVVVYQDGEVPSADDEIMQEILTACSDRNVRPLTDKVQVVPVTPVDVSIEASYYIPNNDLSVVPNIMQALEDYKVWQCEKIGRAVNPDELRKRLMNAGAARIEITSPTHQNLKENEIANITNTSLTMSGSISM